MDRHDMVSPWVFSLSLAWAAVETGGDCAQLFNFLWRARRWTIHLGSQDSFIQWAAMSPGQPRFYTSKEEAEEAAKQSARDLTKSGTSGGSYYVIPATCFTGSKPASGT